MLKLLILRFVMALILAVSILPAFKIDKAAGNAYTYDGPGFIIDHTCTDITKILRTAIENAKKDLHIAYGHTSHGAELTVGMTGLVDFANGHGKGLNLPDDIFAFVNGDTGGTQLDLDENDALLQDTCGTPYLTPLQPGEPPNFYTKTHEYLGYPTRTAEHADVNVIMWSWCYELPVKQKDGKVESDYLDWMNKLEEEYYPDVTFVYMTSCTDHHEGADAYNNTVAGNEIIRQYCLDHHKILYDFYDIESYDPSGNYYPYVDENCEYYSSANDTTADGNWAIVWQNKYTKYVPGTTGGDWYDCSPPHTQPLNGNLKAYAAWWLWARLAGWNGATDPPTNNSPMVSDIPNQTIAEGASFTTIGLDDYVADPDNTDAQMNWTFSGNSQLIVTITDRVATITTPGADWNGAESITFKATDPGNLWDDDSATFTVTVAGSSGGGGGGGGGSGASGTTILGEYINDQGRFIIDITAESPDGEVVLYISQGTIARKSNGQSLFSISIKENTIPPEPPADCQFVCLPYDIGPGGTTFNPPALLTFKYSDSQVPAGVAEENMVFATWQDGKWVELRGGTVDAVNNIVTVPISHFSIYTVMVYTSPASFEISDMAITPTEVYPGDSIRVSATINNNGDLAGSFEAIFKIDNKIIRNQTVTINGRSSQRVSFGADSGSVGEHTASVNDLSDTYRVKELGKVSELPATTVPELSPEPSPTSEPTLQPIPTVTPTALIETPAATEPTETLIEAVLIQPKNNMVPIITGSLGGFLVVASLVTLLIRRRSF